MWEKWIKPNINTEAHWGWWVALAIMIPVTIASGFWG